MRRVAQDPAGLALVDVGGKGRGIDADREIIFVDYRYGILVFIDLSHALDVHEFHDLAGSEAVRPFGRDHARVGARDLDDLGLELLDHDLPALAESRDLAIEMGLKSCGGALHGIADIELRIANCFRHSPFAFRLSLIMRASLRSPVYPAQETPDGGNGPAIY